MRHEKPKYSVTRLRARQKYEIIFQESVLSTYERDTKVYSNGIFAIKLSNGSILSVTENGEVKSKSLPLVSIIVWKDRHSSGIRNDGTTEYKIPKDLAEELENRGKLYYDLTNDSYACDDRKVYR